MIMMGKIKKKTETQTIIMKHEEARRESRRKKSYFKIGKRKRKHARKEAQGRTCTLKEGRIRTLKSKEKALDEQEQPSRYHALQ